MIKSLTITAIALALLSGCSDKVTEYNGKILSKHTEEGRYGSVGYYAKIVYSTGSGTDEIGTYTFDTDKQYESVDVSDSVKVYVNTNGIEEIAKE